MGSYASDPSLYPPKIQQSVGQGRSLSKITGKRPQKIVIITFSPGRLHLIRAYPKLQTTRKLSFLSTTYYFLCYRGERRSLYDVTSCLTAWPHVPSVGGLCAWSHVPSGGWGLCPGIRSMSRWVSVWGISVWGSLFMSLPDRDP